MSNNTSLNATITHRILDSRKQGRTPWEQPWPATSYAGDSLPRIFRTGQRYRGVNVLLLWSAPYVAPFWLTCRPAREMGGAVRKGDKGTQIVFYKQLQAKQEENLPRRRKPHPVRSDPLYRLQRRFAGVVDLHAVRRGNVLEKS